jgi:hypothetical protein
MSQEGRAVALKLPKGTLTFIKNNPIIAEIVGQIVASGIEAGAPSEKIIEALEDEKVTSFLKANITQGTEVELNTFLILVKESLKTPIDLGVMTLEEVEKIAKTMGEERFAYTPVQSIEDMAKSKEA